MSIKLILLEDVEDLGNAGETVNVSEGYARNFLIPRGLGIKESPAAMRKLASRKDKIEEHRKQDFEKAQALAEKIKVLEITITAQAGEDKQLFGSISAHMIAEAVAKHGIEFDAKRIKLEKPIKETGSHDVEIKLHKDVVASLKVIVVRA